MGLPGCGKTTLARNLATALANNHLWVEYFNADRVRKWANDHDFSLEGRLRQCLRMKDLCATSNAKIVIADFICPTVEFRQVFEADFVIWMNTDTRTVYYDTLRMFEDPETVDIEVTTKAHEEWVPKIVEMILARPELQPTKK